MRRVKLVFDKHLTSSENGWAKECHNRTYEDLNKNTSFILNEEWFIEVPISCIQK